MRRISVVLPVYNESESIASCLRGLDRALAAEDHEILVCYDTEEDTTLPAIAAMPDRPASVRMVRNTLGRGALNAIRTGFDAAEGDVVVTTMADLSDPPEAILPMAAAVRAGADVVSGSRYMRGGSQRGGPWLKRTLSRIAGVSLRWIAGVGTHDATSNFRAYSRDFLRAATIESRAGFEIALELTVKAHLAGRVVGEVPSSWVERSSGKSNFRLWRWMPSYLRWYGRAMFWPVVVGCLAVLAFCFSISRPPWSEPPALLHRSTALLFAAGALGSLWAARSVRRRTRWMDAIHVGLWLHPWHGALQGAGHFPADLIATTAASAILLGFSGGFPRGIRAVLPRSRGAGIALAIFGPLVWLAHFRYPGLVPGSRLDPSWAAALSRAAVLDLRTGVDYVFTYGPFGSLAIASYCPELHGLKVYVWEGVFKLCLALLLVGAGTRIGNRVERLLFFLLLAVTTSPDAYMYACFLAVIVWVLDSERLRLGSAILGMSILAAIALVKFAYFPPAILCMAAVAAGLGRSVSWRAGACVGAAAVLALVLLWWVGGQELRDLPTWLRRSLQISTGYGEGESSTAPPGTQVPAVILCVLLAIQSAWFALAAPRSAPRLAAGLVALPILWIVFRVGFVRASDHTPTFFGYTLVAPFLLAVRNGSSLPARWIATACRAACVALSLAGLAAAGPRDGSWARPAISAVRQLRRNAAQLLDPARSRAAVEASRVEARAAHSLPRTRRLVGDRSIDMVSVRQGVLFLNDLSWRPRPVFQSYLAFTPELMELNARFLESDRASEYALFLVESIDRHLPNMEDALALQVIARDYALVLAERGYMLLHHEPRGDRVPVPVVQLERELAFGESLDLSALEGNCHVLSLDIGSSFWGKLMSLLYKSPALHAEIDLDSGQTTTVRIAPNMMRAGVLIDPYLETPTDWMRWYTGQAIPRPVRIRVPNVASQHLYRSKILVRVLRADGIAPIAKPDLALETTFSLFETIPRAFVSAATPTIATLRNQDVLVLQAPSEMQFEIPPGKHVASGRYGILPSDWQSDGTAGADFSVVLRAPGRADEVLFQVHLDPARVELDQRLRYLRVPFETSLPSTLLLRTDPGREGGSPCTRTVWSEIQVL